MGRFTRDTDQWHVASRYLFSRSRSGQCRSVASMNVAGGNDRQQQVQNMLNSRQKLRCPCWLAKQATSVWCYKYQQTSFKAVSALYNMIKSIACVTSISPLSAFLCCICLVEATKTTAFCVNCVWLLIFLWLFFFSVHTGSPVNRSKRHMHDAKIGTFYSILILIKYIVLYVVDIRIQCIEYS